MGNPNIRIIFRRVFEWGSETHPENGARYIAYWSAQTDDSLIEDASIEAYPGFQTQCDANITGEWGLKLIDYSIYHVWFMSKSDAHKFQKIGIDVGIIAMEDHVDPH